MIVRYLLKIKKLEILIQTIRIFSQDIRIELWIEKCPMFIVKKFGKGEPIEGTELSNQKIIRTLCKKENYEYLDILEANIIK